MKELLPHKDLAMPIAIISTTMIAASNLIAYYLFPDGGLKFYLSQTVIFLIASTFITRLFLKSSLFKRKYDHVKYKFNDSITSEIEDLSKITLIATNALAGKFKSYKKINDCIEIQTKSKSLNPGETILISIKETGGMNEIQVESKSIANTSLDTSIINESNVRSIIEAIKKEQSR